MRPDFPRRTPHTTSATNSSPFVERKSLSKKPHRGRGKSDRSQRLWRVIRLDQKHDFPLYHRPAGRIRRHIIVGLGDMSRLLEHYDEPRVFWTSYMFQYHGSLQDSALQLRRSGNSQGHGHVVGRAESLREHLLVQGKVSSEFFKIVGQRHEVESSQLINAEDCAK